MAVPDKAANAPKPETPDDIPPENSGN
jgi:hypothetical protein